MPFHLEINSPLAQEQAIHGRLVFKRLAERLEHYNWRQADHTYPVTGVIADQIAALGIPRAAITINQNGVDLERYRPGAPRGAPNSEITLGFVGFMRTWRGIDTVISLLAEETNASPMKLVLVSDGPARRELKEQAHTLGLRERVVFLGLVQHDRIPEIVGSFDIALQPRVVAYASPLKIFEYICRHGRSRGNEIWAAMTSIVTHEFWDDHNWRNATRNGDDTAVYNQTTHRYT